MTGKERYHAAISGRPVDRIPVAPIMMAWAAHHVGHCYRDYYLDASVLIEAQQALVRDLGIDQVSVISDPWTEASAYGAELDYPREGVGIPGRHRLETDEDFRTLTLFDPQTAARPRNRIEAVRGLALRFGQTHSVLGWVEGPLAEYVDLRDMSNAMIDLMDDPDRFHRTASLLVEGAIGFAKAQVQAGADVIGVGDAAASQIGPTLYRQQVLPLQQKLFAAIHEMGAKVKLHVCGNIHPILPDMVLSGADVIDVDWMVPLDQARTIAADRVALAGNFDPSAVLYQGTVADVRQEVKRCLEQGGNRFVLQPGCEVPPGTPLANVQAFCPGQLR